jgi:hypothetical protein
MPHAMDSDPWQTYEQQPGKGKPKPVIPEFPTGWMAAGLFLFVFCLRWGMKHMNRDKT